MKKTKKFIVYFFAVAFLLIITSPFLAIPAINNCILRRMERKLKAVPLPERTSQIQTKSIIGKLNGNGNGVNYLATLVVESEQSLAELQLYYSSYNNEITVAGQNSDKFENSLLEHGELSYSKLENAVDFSDYYTVYVYDSAVAGSILERDFRGH